MTGLASAVPSSNLLSRHVRAGKVYRREDLLPYSNSVDRELQRLVSAGTLRKLAQGLYFKPKKNVFGDVPPDEKDLLAAFLREDVYKRQSSECWPRASMSIPPRHCESRRLISTPMSCAT